MKTPEKKYTVIRHYTRDGLENFGYDRWNRKHIWLLGVSYIIVMSAAFAVLKFAHEDSLLQWIIVIATLVGACVYIFQAYRYGKNFYQRVKDLPEPIDLDQIK